MFGHDNQDEHNNGDQPHQDEQQTFTPQHDDNASAPAVDDAAADASTVLPEAPEAAAPATPVAAVAPATSTDDLLDIKQEALQALTPLVGHLEQTPEERFRTTMMMIQAADNQALIKTAYEAAKQISSEKERAQALLDIVNEINYFTQHNQSA